MNKFVKTNMYDGITTWNPLAGKCPHDCKYCSSQKFMFRPAFKNKYSGELRLDEKVFKPLGKGKTIFVCGQNDLFADGVKSEWIDRIINHCLKYPENTYMLQTKDAYNMKQYLYSHQLPNNFMIGITLETLRSDMIKYSGGNMFDDRVYALCAIKNLRKFVTIEPVMKWINHVMIDFIKGINPELVYIGANSLKTINLPEPSTKEIEDLINELSIFTEVRIKDNLKRLLK